ncbi:MAG: hypothetical protein BWY36_00912 [Candidatus Diapherotrites archaeon ADurb.Bin253]|nr:MAG: hypothetical protein BWY36_00912 [Candidatus Diapherotrites archaeon ADurb.Bin253]
MMKNKFYQKLWLNYTHNQFVFQQMILWLIGFGYSIWMFGATYGVISLCWIGVALYMLTGYAKEYEKLNFF